MAAPSVFGRVLFQDRTDAGQELAAVLQRFKNRNDVLVLALPRGGVPVAAEVAAHLHVPLDVLNVRKLGVPGHEELAMGAMASGDVVYLDEHLIRSLGISTARLEQVRHVAREELERREQLYRDGRDFPSLLGKTVLLVDDGVATGSTMQAAIRAVRQLGVYRVIVVVPVAPPETVQALRSLADEVVCLFEPEDFHSIGLWYAEFEQLTDAQVLAHLAKQTGPVAKSA